MVFASCLHLFLQQQNAQEGCHKYLPFILHGDGGAFQRSDSIMSQLLLVAIPKSAVHKSDIPAEDTMTCLWSILTWSLSHMFFGKFPERDHLEHEWSPKTPRAKKAGTKLNKEGHCGLVFAISADGEFFQNEFKLQGSSHAQCCWTCGANKSDIPHNDYRQAAKWRDTMKNFKEHSPTEHLITTVPGINGYSFAYDSLHILELGVASHIVANCMFDMVVKSEQPGATQELRLKELNKKVCSLYGELGADSSNQVRRILLSTFCQPKDKYNVFPELTGVKGRQVRYLVPVMLELCQDLLDGSSYRQHRHDCVKALCHLYEVLDSEGLHPGEKASASFKKSIEKCLGHYTKVCKMALSDKFLQWNTVHKHHLACHMPEQFKYLNCKFVSTYTGETMVGFMAALGHSCLNGTPPHLVPAKVAWRYRLGLHLRVTHGDFEVLDSDDE